MIIRNFARKIYLLLGLNRKTKVGSIVRWTINHWRYRGNKFKVSGKQNRIDRTGALMRKVTVEIAGDDNVLTIAAGAHLERVRIKIMGSGHRLTIGPGCRFNNGGMFWFQDSHNTCIVGPNTSMESFFLGLIESNNTIEIGSDCMFSDGVDLRTGDAHSMIELYSGQRTNWPASVKVGNHVWIAQGSRVAKGVTIGTNSVIAANSTVIKSIPANCLAGGMPARVLRTGVSWCRDRLSRGETYQIEQVQNENSHPTQEAESLRHE